MKTPPSSTFSQDVATAFLGLDHKRISHPLRLPIHPDLPRSFWFSQNKTPTSPGPTPGQNGRVGHPTRKASFPVDISEDGNLKVGCGSLHTSLSLSRMKSTPTADAAAALMTYRPLTLLPHPGSPLASKGRIYRHCIHTAPEMSPRLNSAHFWTRAPLNLLPPQQEKRVNLEAQDS